MLDSQQFACVDKDSSGSTFMVRYHCFCKNFAVSSLLRFAGRQPGRLTGSKLAASWSGPAAVSAFCVSAYLAVAMKIAQYPKFQQDFAHYKKKPAGVAACGLRFVGSDAGLLHCVAHYCFNVSLGKLEEVTNCGSSGFRCLVCHFGNAGNVDALVLD